MTSILAPAVSDFDTTAVRRDEAIAWLYGRINYEYNPPARRGVRALKLQRMRELSERLGNPALSIPTVHVAGTKGKGSTAAIIAAILREAGYRTGLFTSPHLEQIEERFWVDGHYASRAEFVELMQHVRAVVEEMDAQRDANGRPPSPTFFEICTAVALLHFERQQAEAVVLEVGLGGRLDATNICHPCASVITSISYDHTRQLGNTLAEIAREKAGIIKSGVPVVSGVTDAEAAPVIERIASQRSAPLVRLGRDFAYAYRPGDRSDGSGWVGDSFDYRRGSADLHEVGEPGTSAAGSSSPDLCMVGGEIASDAPRLEEYRALPLPLLGAHQAANAAVAIATVEQLMRQGWTIAPEAVRRGLSQVQVPARSEVVRRSPTVVLDTAHNVASIEALVELLPSRFAAPRKHLVFAATQDKDVAGMLKVLLPHFDTVCLARYTTNPRGVPLEELAGLVKDCVAAMPAESRPAVLHHADPVVAWRSTLAAAGPQDLICITGSFFLAAELRRVIRES